MIRSAERDRAVTARRGFFGRMAGAIALGVAGLVPAASAAENEADGLDWPGKLKGRHRQVTDVYAVDEGYPLGFVHNFLAPNTSATAVVVLRHNGFPLALEHAMWEKYKIGETLKIIDPETKAAAVKNPYLRAKPGVLRNDAIALDRLLAVGSVFGVCQVALRGHARRLASVAGVSAEEAEKDFTAHIIAGMTVIPSGVWGVNRAQEAGCSYCAGG